MLRRPCLKNLIQSRKPVNSTLPRHTGGLPHPYHHRLLTPTLRRCRTFSVAPSLLSAPKNAPPLAQRIWRLSVRRNNFGTSSKTGDDRRRTKWWWYVSKGIKIVRIPIVVFGVYKLGHQRGLMDYSRQPRKQKERILDGILRSVCVDGCPAHSSFVTEGGSDVTQVVVRGGDGCDPAVGTRNARSLRSVAGVAQKIVETARKLVREEREELNQLEEQNRRSEGGKPSDVLLAEEERMDKKMDHIGIGGDTKDEIKWTFFLVDTPIPNAFVSEIMPHSIFITTAMLEQFIENDDELALVLGHEISHLILGHSSTSNKYQSALGVLEVLILSLDPTEGLLSVFFMASIGYIKKILAAAHSRNNEREADRLGIKIAAMACFNTRRAAHVFRKMAKKTISAQEQCHEKQEEGDQNQVGDQDQFTAVTHFTDTHPPSIERYRELNIMSEEENADKYKDSHCALAKNRFMAALQFAL